VNTEGHCQILQCAASVVAYSDGGKPSIRSRTCHNVTCPPQIPRRLAWVCSGPPWWVSETHIGHIAALLSCYIAVLLHCYFAILLPCYIAALLHCYIATLLHWKRTITICNCRRCPSVRQQNHNAKTNIKAFKNGQFKIFANKLTNKQTNKQPNKQTN